VVEYLRVFHHVGFFLSMALMQHAGVPMLPTVSPPSQSEPLVDQREAPPLGELQLEESESYFDAAPLARLKITFSAPDFLALRVI
jgi:hypothetical protein